MKIKILGSGTSQGVPMIGCNCEVCTSKNPKNNRLRSSIWIETENASVAIDSGPDFRFQMLRAHVNKLNAIVFTHSHKDHIAGLDDVRAFNYWQKEAIDIYASEETQTALKREFYYVFNGHNYPGIPQLNLHLIENNQDFKIGDLEFIPILVKHLNMEVYGFRIGDFTYITDANYISPEEIEKLKGTKVLILNALRFEKHISHFSVAEAIKVSETIGATTTYFTHISHQLGLHETIEKQLPKGFHLAYDGLEIDLQ